MIHTEGTALLFESKWLPSASHPPSPLSPYEFLAFAYAISLLCCLIFITVVVNGQMMPGIFDDKTSFFLFTITHFNAIESLAIQSINNVVPTYVAC